MREGAAYLGENALVAGRSAGTRTTFTPGVAWNGSTTNVVSSGTWTFRDGYADVEILFRTTGAPGTAGLFTATLPVAVLILSDGTSASGQCIGKVNMLDNGTNWRTCDVIVYSGANPAPSTCYIDVSGGSGYHSLATQTSPWTWANGDGGNMTLRYRYA